MATIKEITTWFFGVLIATWLAVMLIISGHIALVQLVPTSFWIDFKGVKVYENEIGWWIELDRTAASVKDVRLQFEIHDANAALDTQYCMSSFSTTVETTKATTLPLNSAFTACDVADPIMQAKPLYLQATYVVEVGYGFTRSVTQTSGPFTLNLPPRVR